MSEAEAERLGGATDRPAEDLVSWTNPRTDRTVQIDRGLDPSWANNPGRDRPRLVLEEAAAKIGALGALAPAAAREAVRQVVESPLLERHLSGRGAGDLPVGWLDGEIRDATGARTGVVLMTPGTAKKMAAHAYIRPEDWRRLLPALFHDADLVVPHPSRDDDDALMDLAFVRRFEDGRLWRLAVRVHNEDRVRLTTLHRIQLRNARSTAKRGKPLRDRHGWSGQ